MKRRNVFKRVFRVLESDRQQVACAGVARGVAQLAHRAGLDLSNALSREVERLADFFERARLAAVETEAQGENLALALVERREQTIDLFRQEGSGRDFER